MMRSACLRPTVLIVSAAAASLVTFARPDVSVRPAVTLWFLLICPGLALVPLFQLDDLIAEATVCLALSIAVDALVGGVALYAGAWSITGMLTTLLGVSIGGTILQIAAPYVRRQGRDSVPSEG